MRIKRGSQVSDLAVQALVLGAQEHALIAHVTGVGRAKGRAGLCCAHHMLSFACHPGRCIRSAHQLLSGEPRNPLRSSTDDRYAGGHRGGSASHLPGCCPDHDPYLPGNLEVLAGTDHGHPSFRSLSRDLAIWDSVGVTAIVDRQAEEPKPINGAGADLC
jgi:hypothetical protein